MLPEPAHLLLIHAAVTWAMAGVIWFIQLVHYPAYRDLGPAEFTRFQDRSTARTGLIVGPLLFTELGTATLLLWHPPAGVSSPQLWFGAMLIGVCWASTLFIQVPLHFRLRASHDPTLIARVLHTNWIRTIAWSARAVLVAVWVGGVV